MKLVYQLFLMTLCIGMLACKTQKKPHATLPVEVHKEEIPDTMTVLIDDTKEIMKRKQADSLAFVNKLPSLFPSIKTLDMKGLMYLQNGSESYNFNVTIRIIQDSLVWVQIKKLGLEGARILATKDSLTIIDRLKRSYIQKSWAQVQSEFKAPIQLTGMIQLLLGQPLHTQSNIQSFDYENNMWKMVFLQDGIKESLYLNPTEDLLNNIIIYDQQKDNAINIMLNDYKNLLDNRKFSYLRDIELYSNKEKKLYVNLEIQETTANGSVRTPFEIPVGYKRSE